jgi:hypothetical protein
MPCKGIISFVHGTANKARMFYHIATRFFSSRGMLKLVRAIKTYHQRAIRAAKLETRIVPGLKGMRILLNTALPLQPILAHH